MPETVYLNGRYVTRLNAFQHIEDRANQFADAVYEVIPVYQNRLIDSDAHIERLGFSLGEMGIEWEMPFAVLKILIKELLCRNKISNGHLYLQISRGVIARSHAIPIPQPKAGLYMVTRAVDFAHNTSMSEGIHVMLAADTRWARPDIKTVGLLANVLAKSEAIKQGYNEVVFTDEQGKLREGSSNNFYAIRGGKLYQYPAQGRILAGITRAAIASLAPQCRLKIIDDGFPLKDFSQMDEAFLTSSGIFITPVTHIDGKMVGDGKIGKYTKNLQAAYHGYMMAFEQEIIF